MEIEAMLEKYSRDILELIESRIQLSAAERMQTRRLFPEWMSAQQKIWFKGAPPTSIMAALSREADLEMNIRTEYIKEVLQLSNRSEYVNFISKKICERYQFTKEELAARELFGNLYSRLSPILNEEVVRILST